MNKKGYNFFEHPSDIGIKCYAKTLNKLFENAVKAIYEIMIGKNIKGKKIQKKINIEAEGIEDLFFQWISEIIFYAHAHRIFFKSFKYKLFTEKNLIVNLDGIKVGEEVRLKGEVKAITYHNYYIVKEGENWVANFVIDV